ncbi:MAG: beta-lactamase family protein, partial [Pirellulales bacterium]|nr:beta-lactamase family protein [Pirellulales bacterium]
TDTLFEACSMSKPVFAYAVLKLAEQGRLDLDKPLVEYLDKPYMPDQPRHRAITARMVLSHTSGLPNIRKPGEPPRVLFEPGSRFEYSGEGFKYLQHVVEHLTGEPLPRWIRRVLLDPVGMKNSRFAWDDRVGQLVASGHDAQGKPKTSGPRFRQANAAASLFCSPREYALFLLEMMRPDRSADHSLDQTMLDRMLARVSKADPRQPVKRLAPAVSEDVHYGLGWQMDATPLGDRFYHGGANGTGFRCYNEFDPRRGNGIVIMTNGIGGKRLWQEVIATVAP